MAGSKFIRGNKAFAREKIVRATILKREKSLLEKHFDFLKCKIQDEVLTVKGIAQPVEPSTIYHYTITYKTYGSPKVLVEEPEIVYNDEIHMFPKDNSLCLYHEKTDDLKWNFRKHHLFDTIIPWTQEWFLYYELYNITGKWEHPHIDHRLLNVKGMNVQF